MKQIFLLTALFSYYNLYAGFSKLHGIEHPTYALIISINSYPEQPGWPSVNSKEDIENIQFFLKRFAANADINVLQNEVANKNNILKYAAEGDQVYIHFSGGGFQLQTDSVRQIFMPYDAPSVADVSDAVMNNKSPDLSHVIVDYELIDLIQKIRRKLGVKGQCLFTMDASHFGPKDSKPQSLIGRGGFLKITDTEAGLSPFIMLTSCLDKEESFFIGEKEPYTRSFSLAIKNYCETLKYGELIKYADLFIGVKKQMLLIASHQTPAIAGQLDSRSVLGGSVSINIPLDNNGIDHKTKLFILSIGISKYNGPAVFENCDDDAILFDQTIRRAFQQKLFDTCNIKTWLLLNSGATKDNILKAINDIITQAKDDDIFAFFFAGFTNQPKNPAGGYEETWFFPPTNKQISLYTRTGFDEKEVLTLTQIKKLFDYIKCDKQLLFTEAGPSENFRREFIRSMIKTNPVLTEIRKRNRVIIVPDKFGWDDLNCSGQHIKHGPGLYFLSLLAVKNVDNNILDLFSDNQETRNNIVYNYRTIQSQCKYPAQYISFFFEKEFVEDLQYYFSKDASLTSNQKRGAGENELDERLSRGSIGNKYALVIGTNKFTSWNQLQNPINDASSIADTLQNLFGFKTTLLKNPSLKEIYNSLYSYRNILQENDQFVLYLAGHGYYDSTIFRDGFIVTSDSKPLRADTFLTSYIPFNQLRNITDNFHSKQIMVLLDVCFSGAFSDNDEALGGNINYNLTGKLTDRTVGRKLQMTTRKYITAGSKTEEVGDDYNGQHSPFAYFLLEGLRRASKEKKYLSSGMLFKFIQSYLEDTVPLQAGFGKDQEKSGSEFIFMAK
jgi:uncharacterized caspase-like protein